MDKDKKEQEIKTIEFLKDTLEAFNINIGVDKDKKEVTIKNNTNEVKAIVVKTRYERKMGIKID